MPVLFINEERLAPVPPVGEMIGEPGMDEACEASHAATGRSGGDRGESGSR